MNFNILSEIFWQKSLKITFFKKNEKKFFQILWGISETLPFFLIFIYHLTVHALFGNGINRST
jgi:hypothetical protein